MNESRCRNKNNYQKRVGAVRDGRCGEERAKPDTPPICISQVVGESCKQEHQWKVSSEWVVAHGREEVKEEVEGSCPQEDKSGVVGEWPLLQVQGILQERIR